MFAVCPIFINLSTAVLFLIKNAEKFCGNVTNGAKILDQAGRRLELPSGPDKKLLEFELVVFPNF